MILPAWVGIRAHCDGSSKRRRSTPTPRRICQSRRTSTQASQQVASSTGRHQARYHGVELATPLSDANCSPGPLRYRDRGERLFFFFAAWVIPGYAPQVIVVGISVEQFHRHQHVQRQCRAPAPDRRPQPTPENRIWSRSQEAEGSGPTSGWLLEGEQASGAPPSLRW